MRIGSHPGGGVMGAPGHNAAANPKRPLKVGQAILSPDVFLPNEL